MKTQGKNIELQEIAKEKNFKATKFSHKKYTLTGQTVSTFHLNMELVTGSLFISV